MDLLSCIEKLDRSSPELWPQVVPGINEFALSMKTPHKTTTSTTNQTNNQNNLNNIPSKWMR